MITGIIMILGLAVAIGVETVKRDEVKKEQVVKHKKDKAQSIHLENR